MKQLRRTLSLILLFCLCLQAAAYAEKPSPGPEDSPAVPVQYSEPVRRLEFCQQLYTALAELGQPPQAVTAAPFTDTTDEAVSALYGAGIVNGDGAGCFLPYHLISQEQAAIMAARAMDWLGMEVEPSEPFYGSRWMNTPSFAAAADLMNDAVPDGYQPGGVALRQGSCTTFLTWFQSLAKASLSSFSAPWEIGAYKLFRVVVDRAEPGGGIFYDVPAAMPEGETAYTLWANPNQSVIYTYISEESALQISYLPDSRIYGEQQASSFWEEGYADYYLGLLGNTDCIYVLYAPDNQFIRLQYWPAGHQDGPLRVPDGPDDIPALPLKTYLELVKQANLPQFMPK